MMLMVISANKPNQVLGEDYDKPVGQYGIGYTNRTTMDDDDRLDIKMELNR